MRGSIGQGKAIMLYHWYELSHAALGPARVAADSCRLLFKNPLNPMSHTAAGRGAAAACEMFERTTRRYGKPEFGITETTVNGSKIPVEERTVWQRTYCKLLNFNRKLPRDEERRASRLLIVAPMSGHYASLLRGTVRDLLPRHDVYITDWQDARDIPVYEGRFDLDDYIDYLIEIFEFFNGNIHVVAVCQPSVPVLAAVSIMEAAANPNAPRSMTLLGGPVDTRLNPTAVNNLAESRGTSWFEKNVVMRVPWPNRGVGRRVYPGFLQLTGFMTMNLDRHMTAHKDLFRHLIEGDGDSVEKHKEFYDEYLAVMDLTAEFYIQTVDTVFVRHALPQGTMTHRGRLVDPSSIRNVPLFTVEGEKDDITGVGQCSAALGLCSALPKSKKKQYIQTGVGHYGVFNGSRFRQDIAPRISKFIDCYEPLKTAVKRGVDSLSIRKTA